MSQNWSKFEPIEGEIDPEVQNIYRMRSNPDEINYPQLMGINQDNFKFSYLDRFFVDYSDPNYLKLSENERIERGLPTLYKIYNRSPYMFFATLFFGGWSVSQYGKIFQPAGIILRRQRVESWSRYWARRGPFCFMISYFFYNSLIYDLNYFIDYYSPEEN